MYNYRDLIIGAIAFIILISLIGYYFGKQNHSSKFVNIGKPPYITQSLVINIYTTKEDYPKYAYFFKGALTHNIMVNDNKGAYVLVPRTTTSIPIRVFTNASTTRFSIVANGIEKEIQSCDFIATTY